MELRVYLAILSRRKWIISITAAVTVAVTVIGTLMITPKYVASTTLRITTTVGGPGDPVRYNDVSYADRLMNTYSKIATSGPILAELNQRLGLDRAPQVEVQILANSELMQITVEDRDPALVERAANTLAEILTTQARELYAGSGKTAQDILSEQLASAEGELNQALRDYESLGSQFAQDSQRVTAAKRSVELREEIYGQLLDQYERARVTEAMRANTISVVEPAVVPLSPSKPRKSLNLALGLLVGLVGGFGLAFLFDRLDTTLYSAEQIEAATELSIIGRIPAARKQRQTGFFNGNSPQEEAFRRLRVNLFTLNQELTLQTLLVTSAEPNEGKSTTVANLARSIAQTGRSVVVVDCDLHLPNLHNIFDLPNEIGLSDLLAQKACLDDAIQQSNIPGVQVITSGPLPSNPAELLGLPPMKVLIDELVKRFGIVLFDAPSLLAVTDPAVLAPIVDGVVLVVGRAQARHETVRAARQQLVDIKARSLGIIVNRAELSGNYRYYHSNTHKDEISAG